MILDKSLKTANYFVDGLQLENENHEEKTEDEGQPQNSSFRLDPCEHNKMVRFLIKDLLKCTRSGIYFVFKNVPFLFHKICGTIISVQHHKDKISLEVHDGTGAINCLLDPNLLRSIRPMSKLCEKYLNERKSDRNQQNLMNENPIRSASLIIASALKRLLLSVPREEDLIPGSVVVIEGKLSEYGGTLYVFINKINLRTMEDYVEYLDMTYKWYRKF